jgi:hypothetical protein
VPKPHVIALRVIESSLPGEGVAQIPQHVFGALGLKHGARIAVIARDRSLHLVARPDPIHTEDGIRMRKADLSRLAVEEGDGVAVQRTRGG